MARYEYDPMQAALNATRSGDPMKATRLIQEALSGRAPAATAPSPAAASAASRIDRDAEIVEPAPADGKPRPGMRTGTGRTRAAATTAQGTEWLSRRHSEGGETRAYRLHVPSGPARGLIVMLHGCTQSAKDFAAGTRMNALAAERGFLVAWPEQSKAANAHRCWNWFEPRHQQDDGEPRVIAGIVRAVTAEFGLPEGKAVIAGLSAGGAMAAVMTQVYPELFAAAAIHSGLSCGSASTVASAFAAMQNGGGRRGRGRSDVPTIIFHGSADTTVSPVNADALSEAIGLGEYALATQRHSINGRSVEQTRATDASGRLRHERWIVEGAAHAWSGGDPAGSFTDATGPSASAEILRFLDEVSSEPL